MPEMTIEIGGRSFAVACQDGEEPYLTSAAQMLDREAQTLIASGARLPADRMLLMAGLMLADRAISAEEELRALDQRLARQTRELDDLRARAEPAPAEVVREVVPDDALAKLDAMAALAEDVAAKAAARP